MKNLYLCGAGGLGREVLGQIQDVHQYIGPRWRVMGFLDDTEAPLKGKACDFGVVGTIQDYAPQPDDALLLCIADPAAKRRLAGMLKEKGAQFETFQSPWCYMGRHAERGEGLIVYGGFGASVNIRIGNFVTLQACHLGHDVTIGDYCTISGACRLLGGVTLGEGVFLGDSVCVAPNVYIGDNAYVGIGSVVVKNVKAGEKVFGNPAREIGF